MWNFTLEQKLEKYRKKQFHYVIYYLFYFSREKSSLGQV